jgi:hypothetical protein
MFQRPLGTTTGRITALTSKIMEEATILELHQASIQDGGRCSDIKESLLLTKKVK